MRRGLWIVLLFVVGCGHPATEHECDQIVTRIAQLELEKQHPHDAKAIQQGIESTKKALRASTMKDCVGKRITDRAMRCVKNAKTSDQIINHCFD